MPQGPHRHVSRTIYVLARDPVGAKTRLAPELDAGARTRLASAMLEDVLAAAGGIGDELVVVTDARSIEPVAARAGATTLRLAPGGTNTAAVAAFRDAAARDRATALVLAADLPLLSPDDVAALFAASSSSPVVVAPDRHGRGTNALLLTPPAAIAPAFGPGSLAAHRERASRAGLRSAEVVRRGLSHDVDEIDDLRLVFDDALLGDRTRSCLAALGEHGLVSHPGTARAHDVRSDATAGRRP